MLPSASLSMAQAVVEEAAARGGKAHMQWRGTACKGDACLVGGVLQQLVHDHWIAVVHLQRRINVLLVSSAGQGRQQRRQHGGAGKAGRQVQRRHASIRAPLGGSWALQLALHCVQVVIQDSSQQLAARVCRRVATRLHHAGRLHARSGAGGAAASGERAGGSCTALIRLATSARPGVSLVTWPHGEQRGVAREELGGHSAAVR